MPGRYQPRTRGPATPPVDRQHTPVPQVPGPGLGPGGHGLGSGSGSGSHYGRTPGHGAVSAPGSDPGSSPGTPDTAPSADNGAGEGAYASRRSAPSGHTSGGVWPPSRRRGLPFTPAPYPPYGPQRWQGHRHPLPYTRRRRSATPIIVGTFGLVAGIFAFAALALAALRGPEAGGITLGGESGTGGVRAGTKAAATANPLYRTGRLTPVNCRVPAIEDGDPLSMKRFLDVLSNCLDESWRKQFDKTDIRHAAPKRVFWRNPGTSPCGSYPASGAAAFYCPANSTMYIGLEHVIQTAGYEPVSHYAVYARVVAHEYGHHVQERSGILAYGYREMEEAALGDRLEISRRIELQAQCFAGAFLGAERDTLPVPPEQYRNMITDVRGRGDDRLPPQQRDHGSGRHYAGWVTRGFRQQTLTSCNTWIADPQAVS